MSELQSVKLNQKGVNSAKFNEKICNDKRQAENRLKYSPFVNELLSIDNRIKTFCSIGDDGDEGDNFYIVTKSNIFIPGGGLPTIEHEIAHMVEMSSFERCLKPDWGFGSIRLRHDRTAKSLFQAIARETRVRAIQDMMTGQDRIIFDNPVWIPNEKFLSFGKFKEFKDVKNWVLSIKETTIKNWNLDRIKFEWHAKLEYIQNWMETKDIAVLFFRYFVIRNSEQLN